MFVYPLEVSAYKNFYRTQNVAWLTSIPICKISSILLVLNKIQRNLWLLYASVLCIMFSVNYLLKQLNAICSERIWSLMRSKEVRNACRKYLSWKPNVAWFILTSFQRDWEQRNFRSWHQLCTKYVLWTSCKESINTFHERHLCRYVRKHVMVL